MANPEHLDILRHGVEHWNKWRSEQPDILPDLSRVELRFDELSGAKFSDASFAGADLHDADLTSADLYSANFSHADLSGANLSYTRCGMAIFSGADLQATNLVASDLNDANLDGAKLSKATLLWTKFTRTNLNGTEFGSARMNQTYVADVDLSTAKGLETVRHDGPSTVGIDTIYRSKGKIPEVFLRGCGVPDDLIGYIKSIAGAVQFYSSFISYSTKDQEFADRLYADLQAKGVRCWFAPHDIKGGRKIHEQVDEAIRLHDKLLLILSDHSMASDWVGTEIANAREREAREKKQMLFPITIAPFEEVKKWTLFDADRGKDSAREIREYFIPDFSNWKNHDSYQEALGRLVSDLKAAP